MRYNSETFTATAIAFVKAGEKAANSANAFAPHAFAALIENQHSIETITAELCKVGNYFSKKGKALATALPPATKKALGEVKRAWTNYGLDSQTGVDVRNAVHGYIGLLSAEQESELAAILHGLDNATESRKAKAKAEYLSTVYPNRPESFAALNKAVGAAINANKPETGEGEGGEGEGGEGEGGEGQPEASERQPSTPSEVLAEVAAYVARLSPEQVKAAGDEMAALLAAIGDAFKREAEADAAALAEAEAA